MANQEVKMDEERKEIKSREEDQKEYLEEKDKDQYMRMQRYHEQVDQLSKYDEEYE